MMPDDRYKVKHVGGGRHWGVMDMLRHEVVIANLDTARVAMHVRGAMIEAWNDGAAAVKTGQVIL